MYILTILLSTFFNPGNTAYLKFQSSMTNGTKERTTEVWCTPLHVRMDVKGEYYDHTFYYDRESHSLTIVDHYHKVNRTFSGADLDASMEKNDKYITNMTTAWQGKTGLEQTNLRNNLQKRNIGLNISWVDGIRSDDGVENVGTWSCKKNGYDMDNSVSMTTWTADLRDLGISESEAAILREFQHVMLRMGSNGGGYRVFDFFLFGKTDSNAPIAKVDMFLEGTPFGQNMLKKVERVEKESSFFKNQ